MTRPFQADDNVVQLPGTVGRELDQTLIDRFGQALRSADQKFERRLREVVEASALAIGRQRREIDDEFAATSSEIAALRADVAQLRAEFAQLPSGTQVASALTASRLLGKRYLSEVRRGLEQMRGVAETVDVDGDTVRQDEHIAAIEGRLTAAIAEWYFVRTLVPKVSLRMKDGGKPNLAGPRKLSDHLLISLLRTIEHGMGGDPAEVVVRGHAVRMCKIGVALIHRSEALRAAAKGLRGNMAGDAKTLRLASLCPDAGLLLGADADEVESVEVAIEEFSDILIESAQRCEDGALRLAHLYGAVRKAHLEKADGLVPALEGDVEAEFERLSAEYQNALANPEADRSVYRMRHLSDCA